MRRRVKELVALREREWGRRITNREIAKAIGLVREQTVSEWMSPEPVQRIDVETSKAIAHFLGVKWYEIYIEEPAPEE